MEQIVGTAHVSLGLVSKVINTFDHYGQATNPFTRQIGHPSYASDGDMNYLESILTANPSLYLDKIQDKLASVCNLHVSLALETRNMQR